jgi:hypothetical protein
MLFAFDGDIDRRLTLAMIAFLDSIDAKQAHCGTGVLSADLGPFDTCGFIVGQDRKLLRGIAEDDTLVHAIPMHSCELREDGSLPPLEQFRRCTNIFDCQREPQPWFQFRMSGGRSGLSVQKWGTEKVSTFQGFITILSQETASWIEVRNRWGAVLKLPDTAGWNSAKDKVSRHVMYAQSGKGRLLTGPPHTTRHAGPHRAVHE